MKKAPLEIIVFFPVTDIMEETPASLSVVAHGPEWLLLSICFPGPNSFSANQRLDD